MFNINSTYYFLTSLAFARRGINWLPKAYPILNLMADIYFGLRVLVYNNRDILTQKYTPLYKIPYYCFGTMTRIDPLAILVFFLALYLESDYEYTTYLSKQDEQLLSNTIILLALNRIIRSSNIM
jgi:hypothetical protein